MCKTSASFHLDILVLQRYDKFMKNSNNNKELSTEQNEELLKTLEIRFEKHMNRHSSLEWKKVKAKLAAKAEKMWSLHEMEKTGGEPDVVGQDNNTGEYIFYDCSAEKSERPPKHLL